MDRGTVSFWLSVFGATTGAILAAIRIFEFYSARRVSFETEVRLHPRAEPGNEIVLLNKSSIPVIISYFDLVWVKPSTAFGSPIPFTWNIVREATPIEPETTYDVTVAPHATHALFFPAVEYLNWGLNIEHDVYLRLWIFGRRSPLWFWIVGPQSST